MGAVYLARDAVLGRRVAVKTILVPDDAARERSLREARAAAAIEKHPNIVMVLDYATDGDISYIGMEFVEGKSLKSRMEAGLGWDDSLRILGDTAVALDFAHARGVIHRDVKPANVILSDAGSAMLADFGVARITGEATITAGPIGTPEYMAPEVIKGDKPVPASDQFSLAVVSYYLLTGRRPFEGEGLFVVFYAITHTERSPPSKVNPSLPKGVDAVFAKALSQASAERYRNCSEFVAALGSAVRGETPTVEAPRIVAPQRARGGSRTAERQGRP
jgi:serine/threonine-protein kinase